MGTNYFIQMIYFKLALRYLVARYGLLTEAMV